MNDIVEPPVLQDDVPRDDVPGDDMRPRPRSRTVSPWLVVGAILAAFLITQGAGWMMAVIGRDSDTVTQQVDARPKLVVRVPSGDVRVTADAAATSANTIDLRAERSWALHKPELEWSSTDDTAELKVACGLGWIGWCSADLELRVPQGTSVRVESDSGDVEANGTKGAVTLSTDSGRVAARNVTGDADLQTDSGDVEISAVTGDLALSTDSGSIDVLNSSAGRVTAQTDSGSVRLDLTSDPQRVDASTDSGDVDIRLPDTAGVAYLLELSTDSGKTDGAVRTDPSSGHTVTAQTDSGNVKVGYR